jgi:hypothetical protein
MSLQNIVLAAVTLFVLMSMFLLLQHEHHSMHGNLTSAQSGHHSKLHMTSLFDFKKAAQDAYEARMKALEKKDTGKPATAVASTISFGKGEKHGTVVHELDIEQLQRDKEREEKRDIVGADAVDLEAKELEVDAEELKEEAAEHPQEQKGLLKCNGSLTDSEIIYWKIVPGDSTYESPITPHHEDHHDKYLTFEYDAGGWNNVRMGMECLLVVAHATGRTLVVPPQQHLYLLGLNHQDKGDKEPHDEMGFEDFFDLDLLRSHQVRAFTFLNAVIVAVISVLRTNSYH